MATKKTPILDEEVMEEENYGSFEATPTIAIPQKPKAKEEPRVLIRLDKLIDSDDEGVKVDQYEHVTLANERGETCYKVMRGEWVEVPVPVFIALKEKYPKL